MQFINNYDNRLSIILKKYFELATNVDIAVAFVRQSGVNIIEDQIRKLIVRGGKVRLIVGRDFGYTEPQALIKLREIDTEIKVYIGEKIYHPKCYLFSSASDKIVIIGSSNISLSAFTNGIEWNLVVDDNNSLYDQIINSYDSLWASVNVVELDQNILTQLENDSEKTKKDKYQKVILDKIDEVKMRDTFGFIFRVNKTFLNFNTHPITILKGYYNKLEKTIKTDHYEVKLAINNILIDGYIYRGNAGYGLYYQIRIKNDDYQKVNNVFKLNESIQVDFYFQNNECLIRLSKT